MKKTTLSTTLSGALLGGVTLLLFGCGATEEATHIDVEGVSLGLFEFTISNNQLSITHDSMLDKAIWVSPADGRLLSANVTELAIKDSHSSYKIREKVSDACETPEIQAVEQGANEVRFNGVFLDCEELAFDLSFTLVEEQLRFTLIVDNEQYNHLTLQYQSNAEEQFYGFGEQYSYLNLKGKDLPILSQEQGIGRGEPLLSTLVNLVVPGASGTTYSSYFSVPHYITDQRNSLFLETPQYARFDLTKEDRVTVNLFGDQMVGRILHGDSMLDLVEAYTEYSGRMKALPDWINEGAIVGVQGGTEKVRGVWDQLQEYDTPISAFWLQDWVGKRVTLGGAGSQLWWNWELDEDRYPNWDGLVADFQSDEIRTLGYINPFLVDASEKGNVKRNLYHEALENGFLVTQENGEAFPVEITDFAAGILDLTHPGARRWIKDIIIDQMIQTGLSGWMADFGEALPFDGVLYDGTSGLDYHNRYPVEWAKLNAEAVEEAGRTGDIVFFMRSGYSQSPRYSTAFWLGDQAVTWDHYDGLKSSVIGLLNGGMSGLSINHSDIGGYTSLTFQGVGLKRTEELLLRWVEVNAFTAMFRTHEGLAPDSSVQVYSNESTLEHFAHFAKVFSVLADYRKELFIDAEEKGYPVVRHPVLHYENDDYFKTMTHDNIQFMLGADIMVAPVLGVGTEAIVVHLPEGEWVSFWDNNERVVANSGGKTFGAYTPLGKPAVFYRAESSVVAAAAEKLQVGDGA